MSSSQSFAWDPDRYLAFTDERGRPFVDLITRIGAESPGTVVDLGCGTGHLTALLARRWPYAHVRGVDSSEEMVRAASSDSGVEFTVGDIRDWSAGDASVDVLVSNAALQWVPGHLDLLPRLLGAVAPGGWFAMQVPGNFGELSHTLRGELAAEPPYAEHLVDIDSLSSHDAATYWEALTAAGAEVDAWETTYLHVLPGEDAVFDWVAGTSLLPTRRALPERLWEEFAAELRRRLRRAYPARNGRVLLPFRRIFAVARVTGTP